MNATARKSSSLRSKASQAATAVASGPLFYRPSPQDALSAKDSAFFLFAARPCLSGGGAVAVASPLLRLRRAGFGLEKPIADNSTQEGRAKNRRVELVKAQ